MLTQNAHGEVITPAILGFSFTACCHGLVKMLMHMAYVCDHDGLC
jgi:hypothetical protein